MSDELIILLHGSANGAHSWGSVAQGLESAGRRVAAPDMLGYGSAPSPSESWSYSEEVQHLRSAIAASGDGPIHLVAHSMGATFALHLLRAMGSGVRRLTLVDPVLVSLLRELGETEAYSAMEAAYQGFIASLPNPSAAARMFVDYWNGPGTWDRLAEKARQSVTASVPKVRLELVAARADTTSLGEFVATKPPTTILVGERTREGPRAAARQLARALPARVVVVPQAGHMIPLTHAKAVVDAVLHEGSTDEREDRAEATLAPDDPGVGGAPAP